MTDIDFNDIRKVFPEEDWDIGYLSLEQLKICAYTPIKYKSQPVGYDLTNDIHFNWDNISNAIVLVKNSHEPFDYSLTSDATDILNGAGFVEYENWAHLYMNMKEAQVLSGIGIRAKNSLIYNYRFGFDSKICVIGFRNQVANPPEVKRVPGNDFKTKYWKNCDGCSDCAKACPVGAIHNIEEPYWLDSALCDTFIGYGNHPTIPSMKNFWHENVYPETSSTVVEEWQRHPLGYLPFDKNGYTQKDGIIKKDGVPISVPFCKECQVQPKCSKWNGKYNYNYKEN